MYFMENRMTCLITDLLMMLGSILANWFLQPIRDSNPDLTNKKNYDPVLKIQISYSKPGCDYWMANLDKNCSARSQTLQTNPRWSLAPFHSILFRLL